MAFDFNRIFLPTSNQMDERRQIIECLQHGWIDKKYCFMCKHWNNSECGVPPFQQSEGTCEISGAYSSPKSTCVMFATKEPPEKRGEIK